MQQIVRKAVNYHIGTKLKRPIRTPVYLVIQDDVDVGILTEVQTKEALERKIGNQLDQ